MDDSGQVDSVVLSPPSDVNWHWTNAVCTPTTKISMPTLVTINLKDGPTIKFLPEMLGNGQFRDVIGGTLQGTTTQSPWIVKIQEARWHEISNGYEYRIGSGPLVPFMPKMLGCVKCLYTTSKRSRKLRTLELFLAELFPAETVELSVLVVARVAMTMELSLNALMNDPADVTGVRLLLGMVHSVLDIIRESSGRRMIKFVDLMTNDIGFDEANRVLLLDVETCSYLPSNSGDDGWDPLQKSRASRGMKTFFSSLIVRGQQPDTDFSWRKCIDHIVSYIHTTWLNVLLTLPSLSDLNNKIDECLEGLITILNTPPPPPPPPSPPPERCCVCLDRLVNCRIQPCHHAATCIRCAALIFETHAFPAPCPLCRGASTHWVPFPECQYSIYMFAEVDDGWDP